MRAALLCALVAGCGGGAPSDGGARDLSAGDGGASALCDDRMTGDAGPPATFANVQRVFDGACVGCHCCSDPLSLSAGQSYAQLINRPTPSSDRNVNESCGGVLVQPGNPTASYLYQKISSTSPCAGQPMPLAEFTYVPLPECQKDLVRRWIAGGAQP